MSDLIVNAVDDSFEKEVLEESGTILVDFWAPWCGPCRMVGPVLEELAEEYKDKLKIVKVNVDENKEVPGKFGVMSIPTMIFFKDGDDLETLVGFQSAEQLKEKIDLYL